MDSNGEVTLKQTSTRKRQRAGAVHDIVARKELRMIMAMRLQGYRADKNVRAPKLSDLA